MGQISKALDVWQNKYRYDLQEITLKATNSALNKRNTLAENLTFDVVMGAKDRLAAFTVFAKKRAFIYEPLRTLFVHSTEVGHLFHAMVGTHSTASWAAIPREGGRLV